MIRIDFIGAPEEMERLRTILPRIILALAKKMQALMFALQAKIQGQTIPQSFPRGAPNIVRSVRAAEVKVEGSLIIGQVLAGGPQTTKTVLSTGQNVDYAGVQERGIPFPYEILPFNKKALRFLMDGKEVIVKNVIHPSMSPKLFMARGLIEMEAQIRAELQAAFAEASQP